MALKEINLIWEVRNEQLNYNSIKLRFCKIKGIVVSSRSIEQHLTLLWEVKEGFPKEVMAQLSPKRLIEVSQAKEEGRMYWDEQVSKGSGVESGRVSPGGLLPKQRVNGGLAKGGEGNWKGNQCSVLEDFVSHCTELKFNPRQ